MENSNRLKRIILLAITAIFILVSFIFALCGGVLRDRFSPTVEWVYPEFSVYGEKSCRALPASAVCFDDDIAYVWVLTASRKYPEPCFEVSKREAQVLDTENDYVKTAFGYVKDSDKVVVDPTDELEDGMRVVDKQTYHKTINQRKETPKKLIP